MSLSLLLRLMTCLECFYQQNSIYPPGGVKTDLSPTGSMHLSTLVRDKDALRNQVLHAFIKYLPFLCSRLFSIWIGSKI